MNIRNKEAFTFVELIVIVTLLVILSSIGFTTYNGYIVGVRDTNRMNQLLNIKDALNLYSLKNVLPIPEESVEIRSGAELVGYQGYLGKNIIDNIGYSTEGIDPKDKKYYSYYLTGDRRYFQLLGLLEESESLGIKLIEKANANKDRYVYTQGARLGILTDINNIPVQEIATIKGAGSLDISNVTGEYKSYLSGTEYVVGTGTDFADLKDIAKVGGKQWSISDNGFSYGGDIEFTQGGGGESIPVLCNPGETIVSGQCRDPHWNNVSLLIHGDDSLDSTTKNTLLLGGDAKVDNNRKKLGAGSLYFDGNGDYVRINDSNIFDFGIEPFTIEAWVNTDARGTYDRIISGGTNSDGGYNQWFLGAWPGSTLNFGYQNGSYIETSAPLTSWNNNQWYHVTVVREGTNVYLFWDGVLVRTWDMGINTPINTGSYGIVLGARYHNQSLIEYYHGNIDELRITKGVARYTQSFTPPLYTFPNQ